MGGGLFKNKAEIFRMDWKQFQKVEADVISNLSKQIGKAETIKFYESKKRKSFGDIDILLELPETYSSTKEFYSKFLQNFIYKTFQTQLIHKNDDVVSFVYDNHYQVDLILTRLEDFELYHFYFDYNDLGNLMGRIVWDTKAAQLGHKKGLSINYEDREDNIIGNIILSRKPKEILEYLGFDYNTYKKGFATFKGVIDFVVNNPNFNGRIYDWKYLNNENRTRNIKRKSYNTFVRYLYMTGLIKVKRNSGLTISDYWRNRYIQNNENKDITWEIKHQIQLQTIRDFGKERELEQLLDEYNLQKSVSDKYRMIIKERIMKGLSNKEKKEVGKKLGKFLSNFPNQDVYYDYILNNSEDSIEKEIRGFIK